jgi:MoxR-like ATPase
MVKNKIDIREWWEVLTYLKTLGVPDVTRRMLLWGIPGSGKTTYSFNLHPEAEMETVTKGMFQDAIFGKFLLKDGSTFWSDNFVTRAARKNCPAIINEFNEAGAELDAPLNKALDDASICRFNLDSGEVVTPGDGFQIVATMNGSPDQLKESLLDRFDVILRCDLPHPGIVKRLRPGSAAFLVNKIRNTPDTETFSPKISTRNMLRFDKLVAVGVPEPFAADLIFGEGQGKAVLNGTIDAARNIETAAGK